MDEDVLIVHLVEGIRVNQDLIIFINKCLLGNIEYLEAAPAKVTPVMDRFRNTAPKKVQLVMNSFISTAPKKVTPVRDHFRSRWGNIRHP